MFAGIPEAVAAALDVTPPDVSRRKFAELDEDGNDVSNTKETVAQPLSIFPNREVLFAEVVWPELQRRAGLKRHCSAFTEGGRPTKQSGFEEMLVLKKVEVCKGDVIKKEFGVIDETTPAELLELVTGRKEAFACSEIHCHHFILHNIDFPEMSEKDGTNHSMSLVRTIHLVLADRPYNIHRLYEDDCSA